MKNMRVSVSLCTAIVLGMTVSSASAMDANEIFNRLKAQAGATDTVQGAGGVRRGLSVSYGDEQDAPTAAAPAARRANRLWLYRPCPLRSGPMLSQRRNLRSLLRRQRLLRLGLSLLRLRSHL